MSIYVVIGAKGGTGAQIVRRLAEKPASAVAEVRCLIRDPSSVAADHLLKEAEVSGDDRVKLLAGDVMDPASLAPHFAGADAVFFAAAGKGYDVCEAVDKNGLSTVADLAKEAGVRRVVLVSSQLVHPDNRWSMIRQILNSINTG